MVVEVVFPLLWIICLVEQLAGWYEVPGVGQHPVTSANYLTWAPTR